MDPNNFSVSGQGLDFKEWVVHKLLRLEQSMEEVLAGQSLLWKQIEEKLAPPLTKQQIPPLSGQPVHSLESLQHVEYPLGENSCSVYKKRSAAHMNWTSSSFTQKDQFVEATGACPSYPLSFSRTHQETVSGHQFGGQDKQGQPDDLHAPLSIILQELISIGKIKPLKGCTFLGPPRENQDQSSYCEYHCCFGHSTNQCWALRHAIQNLIDNREFVVPSPNPKPRMDLRPQIQATQNSEKSPPQQQGEMVMNTSSITDDEVILLRPLRQLPIQGKRSLIPPGHQGSSTQDPRKPSKDQHSPVISKRRHFDPLHAPLSQVYWRLMRRGLIAPLQSYTPPNPLPKTWDHTKFCEFHQHSGHSTERCWKLKHLIQDLIDNQTIEKPIAAEKPDVATNPLPHSLTLVTPTGGGSPTTKNLVEIPQ